MNPETTAGSLVPPAGRPRRFRAHVLLAALAVAALPVEGAPSVTATQDGDRTVQLAENATRTWTVQLARGQAVRARVVPGWLDVELRAVGPSGAEIAHSQGLREAGEIEEVTLLAVAPGPYRLTVHAVRDSGEVRLELDGPRPATEEDRRRAAAERETQAFLDHLRNEIPKPDLPATLAVGDRLVALWQELGDRRRAATLFYQQAVAHYDVKDYEKAADIFHRAEPIAREADDAGLLIDVLNDSGRADRRQLKAVEADGHLREAAALCQAHRHLRQRAIVLSNLSGVANDRGEPREAVAYLRESLQVAREAGDEKTAVGTQVNLCNVHQDLNEREEALKVCQEALARAKAAGLRELENAALNNLGTLYESLGEWNQALAYNSQALAIARERHNAEWEGSSLFNEGVLHQRLGALDKARAAYDQALKIAVEIRQVPLEVRTLSYLSRLAVARGADVDAVTLARRAVLRAANLRGEEAIARQALGEALLRTKELAEARSQLETARDLHRSRLELSSEATAELGLARVARAEGDLRKALGHVNRGIELIESLRVRVTSPDLRASFFASQQDFYTLKIEILMELESSEPGSGHSEAALQTSEQAHARSLLEVVAATARAGLRSGLAEPLRDREQRAVDLLNVRESHRRSYFEFQHENSPFPQDLTSQLFEAQEAYRLIENEVRAASPRYAALTQPESLQVGELQRRVLDGQTVLLEYALGDQQSYLWAVTSERVESVVLPGRQPIEQAAGALYKQLTARNDWRTSETPKQRKARLDQVDKELARTAFELSDLILKPAAHLLPPGRRIVVVGDGALLYVPFAALPAPAPSTVALPVPLLVDHEVVVLPSASVLAVLRAESRKPAHGALAVLADPVFSADDERVRRGGAPVLRLPQPPAHRGAGAGARPQRFARLVFAGKEAQEILALLPGSETYRALGFDASRKTALEGILERYRRVHFATHGVLNTERPEESSLVLSLVDPQGRPQAGQLSLSDVYGLKLNAELVVLSACSTALGKEVRGEGLVGLTRGFMYAGAPRVVASLWNVGDGSTAALMKLFYQAMLTDGLPPAAALRRAQLRLRQGSKSSPYYWAAFSLQGEWR